MIVSPDSMTQSNTTTRQIMDSTESNQYISIIKYWIPLFNSDPFVSIPSHWFRRFRSRLRFRLRWFRCSWLWPGRRYSRQPQIGMKWCSSDPRHAGSGPGWSGGLGLSSGRVRPSVRAWDWNRSCWCTRPPRGWRGSGSSPWTTWTNNQQSSAFNKNREFVCRCWPQLRSPTEAKTTQAT